MAEVVGLMASVIAVAGLAETVLEFVKNAKSWTRDLKTVRDDLSRSIRHISFAAGTIDIAQDILLKYCSNRDIADQSAVIHFMETKIASDYLEIESSLIEDHVDWLEHKIRSLLDMRWTLMVTWKWRISLRDEIEALRDDMLFMQTNLSIVLDCVKLEMEMKREDKNEVEM